ncbi:hypothetical protein SDC9_190818 [bioreactor metagenome]|uniref:Uncharacterized protein n=1 Tax=bioreactor metagenome TaxID=1076179 RepID=A0A645HYJ8_9ZZZZ
MADDVTTRPQLFTGSQHPQPHPNTGFSLGGNNIVQDLRIQQMDGDRRTTLFHRITAGGFGKPDVAFNISRIGRADIHQLHFATAFTMVRVMFIAVCPA